MQKLPYSRREEFELNEKHILKALPVEFYEFKKFCKVKVQINYHVYLKEDKHYYSVPHRYRGLETVINYTTERIEIYCKNERIAVHKRDRSNNRYTTNPEHMPSQHKLYADWNPQRIINWGKKIGDSVMNLSEIILNHSKHPEQGFKTCMGIFQLEKTFGQKRLNKACLIAISIKKYSYSFVKNVLENGMENQNIEEYLFKEEVIIYHENIRGQQYYSKSEEETNEQ